MKKIAAIFLILCGVGLIAYGLLNFDPSGGSYLGVDHPLNRYTGYSYSVQARLEVAVGTVLAAAGYLLKSAKTN